jgi:hypothetical protein
MLSSTDAQSAFIGGLRFFGLGTGFEQQIMLRRNPGSGTWLDFGHHRPKAMAQQ